jgi:membrane protein required for colicin V production
MMTWVDWAIIAVLVLATLGGLAQGFFRTACGLAGLVIGLMAAVWNYSYVARVFLPVVRLEALANAIGFLVIVILVMLGAALLGGFLEKTFRWAGLGCIDTLLGAVFGFFQGIAIVMIFVLVTLAFFPGTWWLTDAKLPPMFFQACHISMEMSPKELSDQVQGSLKKLKRESPAWVHPGHEGSK